MAETTQARIECSIEGCPCWTFEPMHENPRYRWAVDMKLKDDDDKEVNVTLCPHHVHTLMSVNEDFFANLERSEKLLKEGKTN